MINNDLVMLDQCLGERLKNLPAPIPEDVAFEQFACEKALYTRDLSLDDIDEGLVGGGMDGGIDGVYVFHQDGLLADDSDLFQSDAPDRPIPQGSTLEI